MATSNRKKGAYYLKKTIDLLKAQGFQTMKLETNKMTYIKGSPVWIHTDHFASDILAMNKEKILFIQVKFQTEGRFTNINQWKDEFAKYDWPKGVEKELYLWQPKKKPTIIQV